MLNISLFWQRQHPIKTTRKPTSTTGGKRSDSDFTSQHPKWDLVFFGMWICITHPICSSLVKGFHGFMSLRPNSEKRDASRVKKIRLWGGKHRDLFHFTTTPTSKHFVGSMWWSERIHNVLLLVAFGTFTCFWACEIGSAQVHSWAMFVMFVVPSQYSSGDGQWITYTVF